MSLNAKIMDIIADKYGNLYAFCLLWMRSCYSKVYSWRFKHFAGMIQMGNEDAVPHEERLSDNIYEYDPNSQTRVVTSVVPTQNIAISM